jgi:hypothetical protein
MTHSVLMAFLGIVTVLMSSCSRGPGSASDQPGTPTPGTRAAQTAAARASPTPMPRFPTAVIYSDPATGRPVWPTPPPICRVSAAGNERPDLGPSIGTGPIWVASTALPVIPWRNEFIRSVWVVDRAAEGDLTLSGRRTDGDGVARFVSQGAQSATEQLRIPSASRYGPTTGSPTAARYADHQVHLVLPSPGCWEFTARLGQETSTFTVFVYN